MTQIPQPGDTPQTTGQIPESEAPAQSFTPYLPGSVPRKLSLKPLIILGAFALVFIVALIFYSGKPDAAEAGAKAPALDVSKMTASELAKNASPQAARELARRMVHGTQAEQAAVSSAIYTWTNPRLARNLAVAMALAQQKRQLEMMRQIERNRQMMMDGPDSGMGDDAPLQQYE